MRNWDTGEWTGGPPVMARPWPVAPQTTQARAETQTALWRAVCVCWPLHAAALESLAGWCRQHAAQKRAEAKAAIAMGTGPASIRGTLRGLDRLQLRRHGDMLRGMGADMKARRVAR